MSAKATFWAWSQRGLNSTSKLVLLCLADCHNADNGRCDPSVNYISDQTGLNVKTVPNAIKKLAEMGLISSEKRAGKTQNFVLNLPQNWDTPKTGVPKNGCTQKRGTSTPKNGVTPPPKTGDEPIRNLKRTYKGLILDSLPSEISESTAREFIDHRNNLKKPLTQNALDRTIAKAIRAANDPELNYSASQIIEKIIDSGWQGFEVQWLKQKTKYQPQAPQPSSRREMPVAGSEK